MELNTDWHIFKLERLDEADIVTNFWDPCVSDLHPPAAPPTAEKAHAGIWLGCSDRRNNSTDMTDSWDFRPGRSLGDQFFHFTVEETVQGD